MVQRSFRSLLDDIDRFAKERKSGPLRLINLHNAALRDLIDFLDPKVGWVMVSRSR